MEQQNQRSSQELKPFAAKNQRPIRALVMLAFGVLMIAYAIIATIMYSVPHLPLANGRTFHSMLRAQMTVDNAEELAAQDKQLAVFLGSSVVERGIAEHYFDSLLRSSGINDLEISNSGNGGFFARANLPMFRAMLDYGMRPQRVVYGFFLQEFNAKTKVQNSVSDEDTTTLKLKRKTLLNVLRYGPKALTPLLKPATLHIYLFAKNNAFREVHDPTALDKLMFGDNMFERDSTYQLSHEYLRDLEEIYLLCKSYNIPFALYNTPIRPKIESPADLPYHRRAENYEAVYQLARKHQIPIWNYDRPGYFLDTDFQDTYHVTPFGARKLSKYLFLEMRDWMRGVIRQDSTGTLFTAPELDQSRN
jgi:hypothetical protein